MSSFSRRSFLAAAAVAPIVPSIARPLFAADETISKAGPKFKLGLVSYQTSSTWDLKTTLDICKRVGIAAIECRTGHKHGVEPKLKAAQRNDVKKMFADSGVVFWGSGSTCEFHSEKPEEVKKNIELCKEFIKLVADIGGKGVKVRPNGVGKGHTIEQACEQIGKALIECGKAAEDAGIEICVEVHGGQTQIPKNMKAIMEACGHKAVGVTWNSNKADIVNGSIDASFELLSKYIRSCHIHDLTSEEEYPYKDLFTLLKKINYDRYTMIEAPKAMDPKEGEEYLKKSLEKWKELTAG
jgi:sugar phosphate isomerase/epimerase